MEHRHSRRVKIKTGVMVSHNGKAYARGECVDLGLEGMKIRLLSFAAAKPPAVERNKLLELEFHLPLAPSPFCEPAMVVHVAADEVGLMFTRHTLSHPALFLEEERDRTPQKNIGG